MVNCAATSGGGAADYRQLYVVGNLNLVDWLRTAPPRKHVFTSSTSVYGQNDGSLVDETAPTEPPNETSRVLVETERVWLETARRHNFPAMVLRVAVAMGRARGCGVARPR